MNHKTLIIGGGLAGTTLAWTLYQKKIEFLLVDSSSYFIKASDVATGIYNPVTGKRLVKTWLADDIFPYLLDFYTKIELITASKFVNHQKILKPFDSIHDQNNWFGNSAEKKYDEYLEIITHQLETISDIDTSFGGLLINHGGIVDLKKYIEASHYYFSKLNLICNQKVSYDQISISESEIVFEGNTFNQVIFAEGYMAQFNPFFKDIPFTSCKGETITIEFEKDLKFPYLIKKSAFLLPTANPKVFRVGSTYNWDDFSFETTENSRLDLEQKVKKMIDIPFKIIDQQAAIRPTVKDRKPILGKHPKYTNVAIFNGMGTKGISLAPYFANQLVENLYDGKEMMKEVSILRFLS